MKRLSCVLAWLILFVPAVAKGQMIHELVPKIFKAGEVGFAIFSMRPSELAGASIVPGDSLRFTVLGVTGEVNPSSTVFIDATPATGLAIFQDTPSTFRVEAFTHVLVDFGSVLWFKIRVHNPEPVVGQVVIQRAGRAFGNGFGTESLAFVDFALASPGPTGAPGAPGAAGQSVIASSEPAGANCAAGGAKLVSATGVAYVCNGAAGATGRAGAAGPVGPPGPTGSAGFPIGGILLLGPGSPAPTGFSFIGGFLGYGAWKKN